MLVPTMPLCREGVPVFSSSLFAMSQQYDRLLMDDDDDPPVQPTGGRPHMQQMMPQGM
jgi:hypothetical protein